MLENQPDEQQTNTGDALATQTTAAMRSWCELFQITSIAGWHMVGMGVYTATTLLKTNTHLLQTLLGSTLSGSQISSYNWQASLRLENQAATRCSPAEPLIDPVDPSLEMPVTDTTMPQTQPEQIVAGHTVPTGAVDSVTEIEITPPQPPLRADIATVEPESGFYFTGPENQAQHVVYNLTDFMRQSAAVDDTTWIYHLHRGDYSNWFRYVVADADLAATVEQIEQEADVTPADSRNRIRLLIKQRYAVQE